MPRQHGRRALCDKCIEYRTRPMFRIDAYNAGGPWRIFQTGRDDALAVCEHWEDAQLILDALDALGAWDD